MSHRARNLVGCLLVFSLATLCTVGRAQQRQLPPGARGQSQQELPPIPLPGRANLPAPSTPNPFLPRQQETNSNLSTRLARPKPAGEATARRPFNMDAATAKLLAGIKPFNASAEMELAYGPAQARQTNTVPLMVAFLDGRLRTDMDLNNIRAPQGSPAPPFVGLMAVGVNRVINIVRPETGKMLLVYPDSGGYTELPLLPEECAGGSKETTLKIQRTDAGRETVRGQPCAKQKVTLTYPDKQQHEALVWLSDPMQGFPVQIQWIEGGTTVTLRFLTVGSAALDLSFFSVPATQEKFVDQPAMLLRVAARKASDQKNRPLGVPRTP